MPDIYIANVWHIIFNIKKNRACVEINRKGSETPRPYDLRGFLALLKNEKGMDRSTPFSNPLLRRIKLTQ